jgi:hypothetical protein
MDDLERMTNEELEEENQDSELQEGEENETSEKSGGFWGKIVTFFTVVSLFIVVWGFDKQLIGGFTDNTVQKKFIQFYLEYFTPTQAMASDVWAINLSLVAAVLSLILIIFLKSARKKFAIFLGINLVWVIATAFIKNESIDDISNIKVDGIIKIEELASKESKWVLYKSNYPNTVDKIADSAHKVSYTVVNKEEEISVPAMEKLKRVGIQPIDFKL